MLHRNAHEYFLKMNSQLKIVYSVVAGKRGKVLICSMYEVKV